MTITKRAEMHTRYAGLTMPAEERRGISHRVMKDECGNGKTYFSESPNRRVNSLFLITELFGVQLHTLLREMYYASDIWVCLA